MRACVILLAISGLSFTSGITICPAGSTQESAQAKAERIAKLIRQLGHKDFAKRQAASKELDAIGAPALAALRKATSDEDAEIRRRAERLVRDIDERVKDQQGPHVQLDSTVFVTDLTLAESKMGIHRISLNCRLADGGKGVLHLDPSPAKLNEFGDVVPGGNRVPLVTLNCTLNLVRKEVGRKLYEVRGPKIVSRFSLVAYQGTTPWGDGRLLVHGKDGAVRYVINLERPEIRTKPCHPGCFPAGTLVRVPGGTRLIQRIREGDVVTTINPSGKPVSVKVTGVFVTRNRLLKVRTKEGTLTTTETQSIALEGGGFRPAGDLKPGDRIWRWTDSRRRAVAVVDVSAADREADVFNLILGAPTTFIAGDFLVRSKPPAAQAAEVGGGRGGVKPRHGHP